MMSSHCYKRGFLGLDMNRCELLCEAEGYAFFDRLAAQVVDGTSCDEESNDVCIAGQCVVSKVLLR